MQSDHEYMARCLELAVKGAGFTSPNPMVGCVIVDSDGRIIGEGYHHRYGGPHAEVEAISSVKEERLIPDATLYVTLEPCSHYGKTPPCADLIIDKGFRRVVIGATDANPRVAGGGINKLRNAGIEVKSGVLQSECRFVNRAFFTFHEQQRPYVILKWAQTRDGFIDQIRTPGIPPTINWITDGKLKMLVHRWRDEADAILVGARTVINDNPELTTRDWPGKSPLRIVVDHEGLIRKTSIYKVFSHETPTWLYSPITPETSGSNVVLRIPEDRERTVQQITEDLHSRNILSVIVEGGRQMLDAFICSGVWDEARVFTGNKWFGTGLQAPHLPFSFLPEEDCRFGKDQVEVYYNRKGI
ncbi:MAG: bifunctional diaminohydroxyphosphoribosylaminopyrimidine deaminase/5-amino-6-(5-phosphoribosylamino)uracil reductase RibD [Bacteroidales bacterium]